MLNTRSDYLVILVATYNRLELLKHAIDSIASGTRCSHEIIVIDGGSTDGTVEFLRNCPAVTPVFQGKLVGQARACNQVWRQIESRYTGWLNDDTELVPGGLDLAVSLLENHKQIGMVGLKMVDTKGRGVFKGYGGAVSEYGIVNCNHGILPLRLLRAVNYFNEGYHSYGVDPDLTASVMCIGKTVVMTKRANILHHRVGGNVEKRKEQLGISKQIYHQKFKFLESSSFLSSGWRQDVRVHFWGRVLSDLQDGSTRLGLSHRDQVNLINGRFIHCLDPLMNILHPYYLAQQIPKKLLLSESNPYRDLVESR
jgi:glycosyltransferase involved in cell wall biosynthesis